ncbi:heavy metal translocating P-type ATPase [Stieleria varia]|uniref:Copper-exporting P-type ATPase A n=1 Tax=Stieleria varia TaxID=2528005 RepID=A0A5C6AT33_9BACT|nr:heavy metal translocating P-type ATPase [Stieleria varia]TWU02449.1 Copper-exporting P-type ATPase A [Stieleria varia]
MSASASRIDARQTVADQNVACSHCGLPTNHYGTPISRDRQDAPPLSFCCSGCRQAYELIHDWGLDDFYALRDQSKWDSDGVSAGGARYSDFDDDEFLGCSKPQQMSDGRLSTSLSISGIHCAACAWLIENAAARIPGWTIARVKMSDRTLQVIYSPEKIQLSEIASVVGRLGYRLAPLTSDHEQRFALESRQLLMQIAVAGFLAANAMWIAIALYAGDASGVEAQHRTFLRWAGTFLGVGSVLIPGRIFFVSAWAAIKYRTPHMDLPVALGLSVGTVVGVFNAIMGSGHVYFDSLAMLVFLLLIGRWIQFRQQHRAAQALDLMMRITPQHATRIDEDGSERRVPVDSLRTGERIRVHAGESVPADGNVIAGESLLNTSLLTGESRPVHVRVGDEVTAGTVNLTAPVTLSVSATGAASRIGQVMASVENAASKRIPIVQMADRIGGVFVVAVTILAIGTFLFWMPRGIDLAVSNATSLLIVACPCALALATPLAIAVSIGRAATRKILIRDGSVFQRLSKRGVIWFDKTGTLTEGQPHATLVYGDNEVFGTAAALERHCCHPIADAIVRAADSLRLEIAHDATNIEIGVGGISGQWCGQQILVGNREFLARNRVRLSDSVQLAGDTCSRQQSTPIYIAQDGVVTGVLSINDPIKSDAKHSIERLHRAGWKLGILSGDHPDVVHSVAKQLGIREARGGLSPEQKLARMTDDPGQTVVMIGDGANDAAALAAAGVGIAVRGGAEASMRAAPVFIATGQLESVADLVDASRRTTRLIHATFAVSLTYNLVAVVLALTGHISPLLAAILMPISSVSVLTLTLLWPTFKTQS